MTIEELKRVPIGTQVTWRNFHLRGVLTRKTARYFTVTWGGLRCNVTIKYPWWIQYAKKIELVIT